MPDSDGNKAEDKQPKLTLVERLKDVKGDVTLSIETDGEAVVYYYAVAHYEGVESGNEPRQAIANDLVSMARQTSSDDSKYMALARSLMPGVDLESVPVTVAGVEAMAKGLYAQLDELKSAGVKVVKIGEYTPKQFAKAYKRLPDITNDMSIEDFNSFGS